MLQVDSRIKVNDNIGDVGHPVQYDTSQSKWYVNVSTSTTDNTIYSKVVSLGTGVLGESTSRTFINDNQTIELWMTEFTDTDMSFHLVWVLHQLDHLEMDM